MLYSFVPLEIRATRALEKKRGSAAGSPRPGAEEPAPSWDLEPVPPDPRAGEVSRPHAGSRGTSLLSIGCVSFCPTQYKTPGRMFYSKAGCCLWRLKLLTASGTRLVGNAVPGCSPGGSIPLPLGTDTQEPRIQRLFPPLPTVGG